MSRRTTKQRRAAGRRRAYQTRAARREGYRARLRALDAAVRYLEGKGRQPSILQEQGRLIVILRYQAEAEELSDFLDGLVRDEAERPFP